MRDEGISTSTATMLVIASMVGTGVFTTSGFSLASLGSKPAVLVAWLVGGVLALCGALAYAELGAALPKNGGEYQLLSRIYHPAVGFLAGLTSLVVGFAAPIAACAIAFGKYLHAALPAVPELPAAIVLVLALTTLHALRTSTGRRWQDYLTYGKLALIGAFLLAGLLQPLPFAAEAPSAPLGEVVLSSAFAIGLFWVSFSYSGWNAASYLAGEMKDAARSLPRATMTGTLAVTGLYVALNAVFLASAPTEKLAGVLEVGQVSATALLGPGAGRAFAALIALGLVATTGAYTLTGPRVAEAIGRDYPRLSWLSVRAPERGPVRALGAQAALALLLIATASYDVLLTAVGFVLSTWAGLTVLGVIVLRIREPGLPRPYKVLGYPVTPLLFAALTTWMIVRPVVDRPAILVWGASALALGLGLYAWARPRPA